MPKSASYLPWRFSNDGAKFLVLEISFFGRKYKSGGSITKKMYVGGGTKTAAVWGSLKYFGFITNFGDDFVTLLALNAKK